MRRASWCARPRRPQTATSRTHGSRCRPYIRGRIPGGGGVRQRVRFEISDLAGEHVDPEVMEELAAIVEAKHAGVAYIMGHSYSYT